MAKYVLMVKTAKDDESPQKDTELTIDFDGCTEVMLHAIAIPALRIGRQGVWRRKGIPDKEAVFARDHIPGMPAPAETPEQTVRRLFPDMPAAEQAALLKKYQQK